VRGLSLALTKLRSSTHGSPANLGACQARCVRATGMDSLFYIDAPPTTFRSGEGLLQRTPEELKTPTLSDLRKRKSW